MHCIYGIYFTYVIELPKTLGFWVLGTQESWVFCGFGFWVLGFGFGFEVLSFGWFFTRGIMEFWRKIFQKLAKSI